MPTPTGHAPDGGAPRPGAQYALTALADRLTRADALGRAAGPFPGTPPRGWRTMCVVGAGGSAPAAEFIARHARDHNWTAAAARPLDADMPCDVLVLVSYSGGTADLHETIRRARRRSNPHIVLITGNSDGTLAAEADVVLTHRDGAGRYGERERGFISFAGTLAPAVLTLAATGHHLNLPPAVDALTAAAHAQPDALIAAAGARHLDVIGTGWAWPAVLDVESKWTEGKLGTVRIHESKDFSHGRYLSVLTDHRQEGAAVLHLDTVGDTYAAHLDAMLRAHCQVLTLRPDTGQHPGLALLNMIQALAVRAGDARGIDISRPERIDPDGLSLYSWDWS